MRVESNPSAITVLITGANGQLGYALQQTVPLLIQNRAVHVQALTRLQLDLSSLESIEETLNRYQPDVVINAAAYTAVDKAESESQLADIINHQAVAAIARWCASQQKLLVQVSTDFIFDGNKSHAYSPEDRANPLCVYGKTKYAGEVAALEENPHSYVVRTGWVYFEQGANFVKTMLRLGMERESLGIVSDQVGTPTYALHLAEMIWALVDKKPEPRIFHFSDAGVASWYDFAVAIFELAEQKKLLPRQPHIKPIQSSDYLTPAQRPHFSVLSKFQTWDLLDIRPVHWRTALAAMIDKLRD